MKLRVKQNTLRLRLTQTEVAALSAGETLCDITQFSLYQKLSIQLGTWNLEVADAKFENDTITINCPISQTMQWANNDDEGMYFTIDNDGDEPLHLAVEKDYQCLKPREEERDNFPNPTSDTTKC
ncbi:MAG: DUF7009 family protein [Flavobacteriales bacterium]